jgi:hypothetical protein
MIVKTTIENYLEKKIRNLNKEKDCNSNKVKN